MNKKIAENSLEEALSSFEPDFQLVREDQGIQNEREPFALDNDDVNNEAPQLRMSGAF